MILVDQQDRAKLSEGRNWGLGYAFCQKEGETLTTIMPVTACKDFLNDVVYSEQTGKPFEIYGLKTEKKGIFYEDGAWMVLGILPYNRDTRKCADHDKLESSLMSPEKPLESFLSHFGSKLGFGYSSFQKVAENRMAVLIHPSWVKYAYTISLWSLLARVGLGYTKDRNPDEFLAEAAKNHPTDAINLRVAIEKMERMAKGELPVQDYKQGVHNYGIVGFQFP